MRINSEIRQVGVPMTKGGCAHTLTATYYLITQANMSRRLHYPRTGVQVIYEA